MRTALLGILGLLALTSVVGCGPGLTRHSQKAKTPDVFKTMDAELENSLPGTTTLTSAELPGSRLSLAQWEEDELSSPLAPATWGVPAFPAELAPTPYVVDQSKPDPLAYP